MKTYIYDKFVRFFHWNLVIGIIAEKISAENDAVFIHTIIGYYLVALIAIRIVWGFVGSKYARFSTFRFSPRQVIDYLLGLALRKPKHYPVHNPASSYMAFTLMGMVLFVVLTGVIFYGYREYSGPMGNWFYNWPDDWTYLLKEIHEYSFVILVVLIVTHVLGSIISSIAHKQNLIKAIITGYKTKKPNQPSNHQTEEVL